MYILFWSFFCIFMISLNADSIKNGKKCNKPEETAFCDGENLLLSYNDKEIRCGEDISDPASLSDPPEVTFSKAKKGLKYTLIMADPDAPSSDNPTSRYFRHWLVNHIQAEDLIGGYNGQGDATTTTAYMGPNPPEGSGAHRYQFWLYEESSSQAPPTLVDESRGKWDISKYASTNEPWVCKLVASFQFKTSR